MNHYDQIALDAFRQRQRPYALVVGPEEDRRVMFDVESLTMARKLLGMIVGEDPQLYLWRNEHWEHMPWETRDSERRD